MSLRSSPVDGPRSVAVGVDGSDNAWRALEWAADEAEQQGTSLVVAYAGHDENGSRYGKELLAEATARLADGHPKVRVRTELGSEDPARLLRTLSENSTMVVVGRADASGLARLVLVTTGRRLLLTASCPVVVVPGEAAPTRDAVVAGVSTSPSGMDALRFAAADARRRGVVLRGVRTWSGHTDNAAEERREQAVLDDWISRVRAEFPDVAVRGELCPGTTARTLAEAATGAALLVVGCRLSGAAALAPPGPIGTWLARHAGCPIAVVPHAEPDEAGGTTARAQLARTAQEPAQEPPARRLRDGAALRTGGGLVRIRAVQPDDREALRTLDAQASERSIHFRFFSSSRSVAERYTDDISALPQSERRSSLLAQIGEQVVGIAALERTSEDTGEVALLIADSVQHEGIGTLLLEELVVEARRRGFVRIVADVLADNMPMINVLRDLGLPLQRTLDAGVVHVTIDLEADDAARAFADAVTERERRAESASLQPLLAPRSVAVVGVGSRENSVGRAVLRNLIGAGYAGELHVVHPRHTHVLGMRAFPTVADLPVVPDLVVVAVPASEVAGVIEQSGRCGARAALLLTAGFGETGSAGDSVQRTVLASARHYGMRLVGPNCLGIVNTDPHVRLNVTFAALPMLPGGLGLVSQSGAVGIAIMHSGASRGVGVAGFVSVGNKADLSSNDLLLAWQDDPRVSVIALYLESFGNPRKFVRIARTVSRTTPILALKAGRGAAGRRAGMSHTAAAAASEPVVEALFAQAGVQRVDTIEQLLDAVRVIDQQPRPDGNRVAIIGNSGGPEILAADAAESAGLRVAELSDAVTARLLDAVPTAASVRNPVDLGAAVQPDQVRAALELLVESGEVDAVVTVFTETLAADPADVRAAVVAAARRAELPIVATEVGSEPTSVPIGRTGRLLPVFGFPEPAVESLAVAVHAAAVGRRPASASVRPDGVQATRVRQVVARVLACGGGWADPVDAAELLRACGIRVIDQVVVRGTDAATGAAAELGYPVVIKLAHGVHKSDRGGVFLDLRTAEDVGAAMNSLGDVEVLVQPMHAGGVEIIVGGVQDPQFGPVVLTGAGGVLTELAGQHSLRLAPLGEGDLEAMMSTPTMNRLLDGFRGHAPVSRVALADLIRRVGWLVEHVPEVAELDLNPVLCTQSDLVVVDAKLRIAEASDVPDPVSRLLNAPASG